MRISQKRIAAMDTLGRETSDLMKMVAFDIGAVIKYWREQPPVVRNEEGLRIDFTKRARRRTLSRFVAVLELAATWQHGDEWPHAQAPLEPDRDHAVTATLRRFGKRATTPRQSYRVSITSTGLAVCEGRLITTPRAELSAQDPLTGLAKSRQATLCAASLISTCLREPRHEESLRELYSQWGKGIGQSATDDTPLWRQSTLPGLEPLQLTRSA